MSAAIVHRGPDDHGFLVWSGAPQPTIGREIARDEPASVGIAHRRLSIIELGEGGWQPMSTSDGRYYIAFNGEIYNYLELRAELIERGYRFRSASDTEVLLNACAEWGTAALTRLVGMFAFALLDTRARRLRLVRDFFGIKPIYYATWDGGLAFGSEIKALLEIPKVSRRADPQRLCDYVWRGFVDDQAQTMFADVRHLPPAHFLDIDLTRPDICQPERYWELKPTRSRRSRQEIQEELREIFLDNVRLHLRSDVPVGAALSGGIDSSSIVTGIRAVGGHGVDLQAVGFVADDARISEEHWIDIAAAAARAHVHKVRIEPEDLSRDLDVLIKTQDEPFGGASIYAQYRVFQTAAAHRLKVMLDGQGADEMLAGYPMYLPYRLAGLLRRGAIGTAARFACRATRWSRMSRQQLLAQGLFALTPPAIQTVLMGATGLLRIPAWMDQGWARRHEIVRANPQGSEFRADLHGILAWSLQSNGLPTLLRYEDRNSMAHSVESRVPFLTPRLANFIAGLPESSLIGDDGLSKAAFRYAMQGLVPDPILNRRDKIGFEPPERNWLVHLDPWVRSKFAGEETRRLGLLNSAALIAHWDAVQSNRAPFTPQIWRWLNLILWADTFSIDVP